MLQFLKDMVKAFNVGPDKTHVAVVAYSTGANVEFKFDRLKGSEITEEGYYGLIDRIRFQRGFTFIDKALALANQQIFTTGSGMRPELPQVWTVLKTSYMVLRYRSINGSAYPARNPVCHHRCFLKSFQFSPFHSVSQVM